MARRVFRVLLILTLAALAGVTGWQVWSLDRTRNEQRADAERLQRDALRVSQAILDLRASQRAYVSPGQGIAAWKPRVDAHLAALREHLQTLREQTAASSSPSAAAVAQADDEALEALAAAKSLEQRIADHVTSDRLQHAADLVYADGVRISLTLERAANAAFAAHAQELQARRTRVQWTEGALLGLAAAIGFVLALLVVPARRTQAEAEAADETGAGAERAAVEAAGQVETGAASAAAAGKAGRRGEAAAQGLGLSSGGRSTAAGAGTAGAGAAAGAGAILTGRAASGGAAVRASARAASKGTGAGRTTPAIAASGRTAPSSPAPAITMADDLPLHAPPTAYPSAAAGAAQGRDRRDPLPARDADARAAMGAAADSGGAARQPQAQPVPDWATGLTGTGSEATGSPGLAAAVNGQLVQTEEGLLAAAAELTVSVARVGDVDGLKPVMARLAEHLDAVGLIVWLEDASTQRLTPIVTHGYPAETLAHLPPIDLDADNATARAWRLEELQVVASRGSDPGAIVVPMPSSAGCVGVVAAEVRHGREHDPATLALARILAAQLAMLTGQRG